MAKRVKENNSWIRTFEVSDPTRHRKGFTVYKVTSTVFPTLFPEGATQITVWKRYSDFRKLHKELEQIFKQLHLKGQFPAFPKAKVFGRFEHEVIEERRIAAVGLLDFTAKHTQLFTSKAFVQFFENGYKSEDFIGSILFSQDKNGKHEPPTTVLQEKCDIDVPCLEPEKVWTKGTAEEDNLSLSLSSLSSSLSPDNPETTTTPCQNGDITHLPSSSSVNGHDNKSNGTQTKAMAVPSLSTPTSSLNMDVPKEVERNKAKDTHTTPALSSLTDTVDSVMYSSSEASTSRGKGIVRSSTVTDDLSSYFEDEFEDAAFLFPAGSCASLDALPGFHPSGDDTDSHSLSSKTSSTSNRTGLFSLSKKKNGFGFFDFLPLFPKKSKKPEKKKDEGLAKKSDIDKLSVGYICEAAGHFAVAQFHESNMEYGDAFAAYKEGIRVLLAGAQEDNDRDRKILAKNKLEKYLSRAESLKDTFLSPPGTLDEGTGGISPVFSSPNKKAKCLSSLNKSNASSSQPLNGRSLLSSLEELRMFKVVARSPWKSNVLIVMNPEEETPKCYAAKVLWKSPCVIYADKPTIIPCRIPFMVKLLKWFETSDKIILLLEYVGGGRLVDFVTNYQSKRISFVMPPDESTPVDDPPVEELVQQLTEGITDISVGCKSDQVIEETEVKDLSIVLEDPQQLSEVPFVMPTLIEPNVGETNPAESTEASIENDCPAGSIPPPVTPIPLDNSNGDSYLHETDQNADEVNADLLEVRKLLEDSKALLLNVTKTLEEGNCPQKLSESLSNNSNADEQLVGASSETSVLKSAEHSSIGPELTSLHEQSAESNPSYTKDSTSEEPEDSNENQIPKRMVPEGCVREWAAELVQALESLHDSGITYGDLDLNDILLGENGHISLRYKCLWKEIDDPFSSNPYMAPEVRYSIGVPLWKIHPSADWWSLGAILFWLFTGQTFHSAHPEGIFPEMVIKVPDTALNGSAISRSAQTLLSELLQFSPELRLGYYGAAEIKTHPFFEGFDWDKATDELQTGSGEK